MNTHEPAAADSIEALRSLSELRPAEREQLAELLLDCVAGGASIGFMASLTRERARAYWDGVEASVRRAERLLLIAEDADGIIIGSIQLVFAQPDNQRHRADVSKMLVLQRARRRGVGAALLRELEVRARDAGRTLLVLDTATPEAARLYARLGWQQCGMIPRYARWPDGRWCDTVLYYRGLDGVSVSG